MKAIYLGLTAAAVITVGAWYGLANSGFTSAAQNSSESVRLD